MELPEKLFGVPWSIIDWMALADETGLLPTPGLEQFSGATMVMERGLVVFVHAHKRVYLKGAKIYTVFKRRRWYLTEVGIVTMVPVVAAKAMQAATAGATSNV